MKKTLTVAAAAALALTGMSACTKPAAKPLPCLAVASPANPVQGSVVTVTVKTSVSGVAVQTVAHYKSKNTTLNAKTNAHGAASTRYNIGTATPGYKVTVTARLAKGAQRGSCSTSFTPKARSVSTPIAQPDPKPEPDTKPEPKPDPQPQPQPQPDPKPIPRPLKAAIAPSWAGTALGETITNPGPSSYPACFNRGVHPRTGGGCGTLYIDATVSNFSGYGGLPTCPESSSDPYCNLSGFSGGSLSGSLRVDWRVECLSNAQYIDGSALTELGNIWQDRISWVWPYTRISPDAAKLTIGLDLNFSDSVSQCSGDARLISVSARNISLHLTDLPLPSGTVVPGGDFFAAGPFAKPGY